MKHCLSEILLLNLFLLVHIKEEFASNISLGFRERAERPEDWVPAENDSSRQGNKVHKEYAEILEAEEDGNGGIVDIFSIHSGSAGSIHPPPSKLKFDWRLYSSRQLKNQHDMLNEMLGFLFWSLHLLKGALKHFSCDI